jgi:hypothetical protein
MRHSILKNSGIHPIGHRSLNSTRAFIDESAGGARFDPDRVHSRIPVRSRKSSLVTYPDRNPDNVAGFDPPLPEPGSIRTGTGHIRPCGENDR